jgi:2-oxoisovalerate dehydrogenase E1 component
MAEATRSAAAPAPPPARPAESAIQRAKAVDEAFLRAVEALAASDRPPDLGGPDLDTAARDGSLLTKRQAIELFESMVAARHLDLEARAMRARGEGFYTIGSAGHEGNAALAAALRVTDPAMLHYRSGAFFAQRAKQRPGETPTFDVLLSLAGSAEDPISGGRHKVFGSATLAIPPQTSTIASHLPKALGMAIAIERMKRLGLAPAGGAPPDAIVACSFGDASLNHATAQAAFNAAGWCDHQRLAAPVLFVCEDNGIGISVPTPRGWVAAAMGARPGLRYFHADGLDIVEAYDVSVAAVRYVRETRRPAFLHLEVVRLLAHAGSDVETTYHTLAEIEAAERRDPLLRTAAMLVASGALRAADLRAIYEETRARVQAAAREVARRPKLRTAAEVMAPLAPHRPALVEAEARRADYEEARLRIFGSEQALPERAAKPRHMAVLINQALADLLAKYPEMAIFGEDVGKKGGVYNVTADLQRRAGRARVFDTLLDETTILGLAIGAGMAGMLPCPEIQYLAYVHNALDQIRGEACSLQYFSGGRFRNPMVVRIAGLGYQKGFGGHFHNDNSTAALRDIPGLAIACPSRGDDAAGMLRTLFAAAKVDGRVSVFLEPIALYMTKDLLSEGDERWLFRFPPPGEAVPLGKARVYRDGPGEGDDVTIVTYGNGVLLSLRAAERLAADGVRARVVDLRWLAPLDEEAIVENARATGRVLVVDEGRQTGGVAEPVLALLALRLPRGAVKLARVAGADTYIPLGDAAYLCLPSEAEIAAAAKEVAR